MPNNVDAKPVRKKIPKHQRQRLLAVALRANIAKRKAQAAGRENAPQPDPKIPKI